MKRHKQAPRLNCLRNKNATILRKITFLDHYLIKTRIFLHFS